MMFYILWALLSLAAFFYFIYVVVLSGKLIREKLGFFAMIIFALILLSFVTRPTINPQSNNEKKWIFTPADSLDQHQSMIDGVVLERTPISQNIMGFTYAADKRTHKNRPISAYAVTGGVVIGTSWKSLAIQLDTTADNQKFRYSISGVTEWKLLGITMFSQAKSYTGIANLK